MRDGFVADLKVVVVAVVAISLAVAVGCSSNKRGLPIDPDGGVGLPQCADRIDNDGDGKIDFPEDPGCLNANQDSEVDDCPDGPGCPECGNGKDDDGDGLIDFGKDPDCTSASDPVEKGVIDGACGPDVPILPMPATGVASGTVSLGPSRLISSCGGLGPEIGYQLDVTAPITLSATTDAGGTAVDTVLYLRAAMCADPAKEVACNDNASTTSNASTLSADLAAGTYYLVIDTASSTDTGPYELHLTTWPGQGEACDATHVCAPGHYCRVAPGATATTCQPPHCNDGHDDDGDSKTDYPADPGCTSTADDDEADDCPSGPGCPACGNGKDDDGDMQIDYPADTSCHAASQPIEGCATEQDPMILLDTGTASGTTVGMHDDWSLSCTDTTVSNDVVALVQLPRLDSLSISTTGSALDTVIGLFDQTCGTELACNDEDASLSGPSQITQSHVAAGLYAIVVDGYAGDNGAIKLAVTGVIAAGARCDVALFASGALTCASGSACDGAICKGMLECNDGVDNDGDHKIDYPDDPGCESPTDTTEADDCPSGPGCPACGNGKDDDGDGAIDYPADPTCTSASGLSELCTSADPIAVLTTPTASGDTTSKTNDFEPACASSTGDPDDAYQLDLPALSALHVAIDTGSTSWSAELELLGASCGGTADECGTSIDRTTALAAGRYFVVVDGDGGGAAGAYTLTVSGTIAADGACDGALATSGALTCASGYACKGNTGAKKCKVAQCDDGADNDNDGKKDYPNDPGCTSPSDDSETDTCPNGASCPACSNGKDDDGDGLKDYPADFGCASAAGTTEVFCATDQDKPALIGTPTTSSTTATAHDDFTPDCASSSTAPDKVYALNLPVPVDTLTLDTDNSAFDTVLSVTDNTCGLPALACDDASGTGGPSPSRITMTSVAPGAYGVIVDGYDAEKGGFLLHVNGIVASGTTCTSSLFVTGVLTCPAGEVCKAGKCAP